MDYKYKYKKYKKKYLDIIGSSFKLDSPDEDDNKFLYNINTDEKSSFSQDTTSQDTDPDKTQVNLDFPEITHDISIPSTQHNPNQKISLARRNNIKANVEKRHFIQKVIGYQANQPPGLIPVFGYGSNSRSQLSSRLGNKNLLMKKAVLKNYTRIFCGIGSEKGKWGMGGLASIYPDTDQNVKGSVSYLDLEELKNLNRYEGMSDIAPDVNQLYRYQIVNCGVWNSNLGDWESILALVYIWNRDPVYKLPPSSNYLEAIKNHLQEFWNIEQLEIKGLTSRGYLKNYGYF